MQKSGGGAMHLLLYFTLLNCTLQYCTVLYYVSLYYALNICPVLLCISLICNVVLALYSDALSCFPMTFLLVDTTLITPWTQSVESNKTIICRIFIL